jgi:putative oxygen-independent coproporphyrinogen III oxidase
VNPATRNTLPETQNPKPETHNQSLAAGLYIHIPFCIQKCPYCDFYSISDLSLIPDYLSSLTKEMPAVSQCDLVFDTIYFGGGTPSVLTPKQITSILENIFRWFHMAAKTEITIEVNPGTVSQRQLRSYYLAGIRRINIGVQSFNLDILGFLKRIHSADEAIQAVWYARDAGFENLGIDLIYGVPGQDDPIWRHDLKTAVAFSPEHLSCYMLSYEKGTSLELALRNNRFKPLADEVTADLFELTHTYLSDAGYEHYEISNFSKKDDATAISKTTDFRSRHNRKYWAFAPYIGLGPAAHSYIGQTRSWNHADINRYIACLNDNRLPIQNQEIITEKQMMIEAIYLGLRTAKGIDIPWFEKKFQINFENLFSDVLHDMISRRWVTISNNQCALTLKGMLLLDSIAQRLIAEIGDD